MLELHHAPFRNLPHILRIVFLLDELSDQNSITRVRICIILDATLEVINAIFLCFLFVFVIYMYDLIVALLTWISSVFFNPIKFHADLFWAAETLFFFAKSQLEYYFATNDSAPFVLKLALAVTFLAAVKGGTPRYRYDFLTKMGWVKFLGYLLCVFLSTFCIGAYIF